MFLLIIFVSIVTLLVFVQNNKGKDNVWYRLIAGICFTFSWVLLVMWFTVLIENWQIALSAPAANSGFIPSWGHGVQKLLRNVAFLLPVSRLGLAVLYGLPILLIPIALIIKKKQRASSILLYSTLLNLLFLWTQLIAEHWSRSFLVQIPLQGAIFLASYVLVLVLLMWQRPFTTSPKADNVTA